MTTMPFETDESGPLRRATLMSQHRCTGSWTDEAMDDADAIYTTTPPHMLMGWRHPLHQHRLPRPRLSCHDIDSVQLQVFSKHLQSTTTTTPFETDEAERHGRALLVL